MAFLSVYVSQFWFLTDQSLKFSSEDFAEDIVI